MGRVSTPILLYILGFNRVRGEGEKNWQSKLEKCFSYCYFFFTHTQQWSLWGPRAIRRYSQCVNSTQGWLFKNSNDALKDRICKSSAFKWLNMCFQQTQRRFIQRSGAFHLILNFQSESEEGRRGMRVNVTYMTLKHYSVCEHLCGWVTPDCSSSVMVVGWRDRMCLFTPFLPPTHQIRQPGQPS